MQGADTDMRTYEERLLLLYRKADILAKNVNGDDLQNVWFGKMTDGNPAERNVIGYNGSGNEVAAKEGVMTLLCGQNIENSWFRDDTWDNVYAGSVLDTRLKELGAAMFDTAELTYNFHPYAGRRQ